MGDVSNGPVSTLPGHYARLPAGSMCDEHPERPAVRRVQGETDSFGCEYIDMCQACLNEYQQASDYSGKCNWCGKHVDHVYPHRDIEEGSYGRVYEVCKPCIDAERQRWDEEEQEKW